MEVTWDKDILKEIACENLPVESRGVGRGTTSSSTLLTSGIPQTLQ